MLGRPIVSAEELQAHRVTVGNMPDVIWAPLYDFLQYATAGQLQLSFFAVPVGQGTTTAPGATGTKTLADTNLTTAGQLTKGNEFFMVAQEILFYPGVNPGTNQSSTVVGNFINDLYAVSKAGVLTLKIGSDRNYIQDGPLGMFPACTGLSAVSALAGAVTGIATTINLDEVTYARMAGETYTITPLYIESNQGFQETVNFPAVVALPSGAAGRIGSRLRGYLIRQAQ